MSRCITTSHSDVVTKQTALTVSHVSATTTPLSVSTMLHSMTFLTTIMLAVVGFVLAVVTTLRDVTVRLALWDTTDRRDRVCTQRMYAVCVTVSHWVYRMYRWTVKRWNYSKFVLHICNALNGLQNKLKFGNLKDIIITCFILCVIKTT